MNISRDCGSALKARPGMTRSDRCALGFRASQMFVQPRHDLDEIAGPRAVIELGRENDIPRIAARRVKPVPPVVMIASTPGSAIHFLMMLRIASTSSRMISRAARL